MLGEDENRAARRQSGCSTSMAFTTFAATLMIVVSVTAVLIYPFANPCNALGVKSSNPWLHDKDPEFQPCRELRRPGLLWLNYDECDFARRLVVAIIAGVIIGFERRLNNHVAGIRTLSLVSLGSCTFTICSIYGFQGGNMNWDASRVAAAIPSGVGFLGAGVIWKGISNTEEAFDSGKPSTNVFGLTTAASVWLSASVGVAAGGNQIFLSLYGAILVAFVMGLKAPKWAKKGAL